MNLKQINKKDQLDLKKLYFDSIISIDERIYNKEQKIAWASQAWNNKIFDLTLEKGKGWLIQEKKTFFLRKNSKISPRSYFDLSKR